MSEKDEATVVLNAVSLNITDDKDIGKIIDDLSHSTLELGLEVPRQIREYIANNTRENNLDNSPEKSDDNSQVRRSERNRGFDR